MRILFITTSFPSRADDARGIFVKRLATALVRTGVEVTVLAPGARGAPAAESVDGVRVIRQTYWVPRWQSLAEGLAGIVPNLQARPWLAAQVPALVGALALRAVREARSCDLVHAHWIYPGGVAAAIAARVARRPLVVTGHGGDVNLAEQVRALRGVSRMVCRAADTCVGVSEAVTCAFRRLGVPPDRAAFIPLGVETPDNTTDVSCGGSAALDRFRSSAGLRVVYLGSLIPRKSVPTLLAAHRRVECAGHTISTAIVGDGPDEARVAAAVREIGGSSIMLAGSVPPAQIGAWLAAAHVLVLPSLSEGRPTVVIEAMAHGVPVVATDIPGTRELVRAGETGLLFPPGDDRVLAAQLIGLIDEERRRTIGGEGRRRVADEGLTTAACAERYRRLYGRLIGAACS
jgi:glycosyltransferase involved in cell wall biosynthesis